MNFPMNAEGYRELLEADKAWLLRAPQTLERDHIILILNSQIEDAEEICQRAASQHRKKGV